MSSDDLDLVWREIGRIGTCMLITVRAEGISARPMLGSADRPENAIWFVGNRERHDDAVAGDPRVCLTYADIAQNVFVAVAGEARIDEDRTKLRKVWMSEMDAWFDDGPDDPAALLVRVTPQIGEYWDNPNSDFMIALQMLTASDASDSTRGGAGGEAIKVDM